MQTYAGYSRVINAVGRNAFKVKLPLELLDKLIHNVFSVSQLKQCRSKTHHLDPIKNSSDSFVRPPHLPPDETDYLDEPVAEAETTDMSPEISHISTQSHSDASQRIPPNLREDVKIHPFYFHRACRLLKFKPTVDLFASAAHHQIERYYTLDFHDRNAAGVNAFSISWTDEFRPYINQPFSSTQMESGPNLKSWKSSQKWLIPQSVKDAQAFLGLAGFCERFFSQFVIIAAPLTSMLKNNAVLNWTPATPDRISQAQGRTPPLQLSSVPQRTFPPSHRRSFWSPWCYFLARRPHMTTSHRLLYQSKTQPSWRQLSHAQTWNSGNRTRLEEVQALSSCSEDQSLHLQRLFDVLEYSTELITSPCSLASAYFHVRHRHFARPWRH